MNSFATEIKKQQVTSWIQSMRNSPSEVLLSDYCYSCIFSGSLKKKTLIVFPDEVETKGVIAIDKALKEVEMFDIIRLHNKIKCD